MNECDDHRIKIVISQRAFMIFRRNTTRADSANSCNRRLEQQRSYQLGSRITSAVTGLSIFEDRIDPIHV